MTARAAMVLGVLAIAASGCDGCIKDRGRVSGWLGDLTAEGSVVNFLKDRKDGHTGKRHWRVPLAGWEDQQMPADVPLNPSKWDFVLTKHDGLWYLARYRIRSTDPRGVPIEKLWDFCVHNVDGGYYLAAAWDAHDTNTEECNRSFTWSKFQHARGGLP